MNIIQKDISWLVERVPDFYEFYCDHKEDFAMHMYKAKTQEQPPKSEIVF